MYTTCFNFGWKIHECVLKYDSDRLQVKQVSNPSLDPGFLGSPLTLIGKQLNSNYTYPNTFQKSKLPIKEPYYRTIKRSKGTLQTQNIPTYTNKITAATSITAITANPQTSESDKIQEYTNPSGLLHEANLIIPQSNNH